ncbi:MAG: L,D-transpeptidase family protein [Campylobacterales bacterium]|nr:L,D-transpeptidase family protein [Campylobacterales bacterium]
MRFLLAALVALLLMLTSCTQNYDMPPGIKVTPVNGKYPTSECLKELSTSSEIDPSKVVDKIRVFKGKRVMELIKDGKVIYRFPISLGKNPKGHKVKQGDFKTPIGHYKIVQKRCDPKYYRSILISYPDAEDITRARRDGVKIGGGITIHAQPIWNADGHGDKFTLKNDWTNGCIAITVGAMKVLWASLKHQTPIDIHP